MNQKEIIKTIVESNFNSLELNKLADEIRTQAIRGLNLESIKKKKEEIEKLEQDVREIDERRQKDDKKNNK